MLLLSVSKPSFILNFYRFYIQRNQEAQNVQPFESRGLASKAAKGLEAPFKVRPLFLMNYHIY